MFLEMDSTLASTATSDLPLKLTGRSGAQVERLYNATAKTKGAFDKAVRDLEGFVGAVRSAGLVVDRFFSTSNYSPEECKVSPGHGAGCRAVVATRAHAHVREPAAGAGPAVHQQGAADVV